MKVLVLTGSPNINGATAYLADEFITGATAAGHEVRRFDTAMANIKPCKACFSCHTQNRCAYEDDMSAINEYLLEADAVVLATPLYYFGMTAQLKTAVDRFFSVNQRIMGDKKAFLLSTCGNPNTWVTEGLIGSFNAMCRHLRWENSGIVVAYGCRGREALAGSETAMEARRLGETL